MRALPICALILPLVACSNEPANDDRRSSPDFMEQRAKVLDNKQLDAVPPQSDTATTGEVPPEVLNMVYRALEQLTGSGREVFTLKVAQEQIWPNGALGCPQPGMVYAQKPEPGFQVVVEHNGREYDYRSAGIRYVLLCLAPATIPPGSPVPNR